MERNVRIDALKGFAIIAVVFSHIMQNAAMNTQMAYVALWQMPLFMFAAGLVVVKPNLKSRAKTLLIPFVFWTLIYRIAWPWDSNMVWQVLWFLGVLYLFLLFMAVAQYLERHGVRIWISFIAIWLVAGLVPWPAQAHSIFYLWPFFCLGYLLKKQRLDKRVAVLALAAFPLIYLLSRNTANVLLDFRQTLSMDSLVVLSTYLAALAGIVGAVSLIRLLPEKVARVLAVVGWYSIDIYVMHRLIIPYIPWWPLTLVLGVTLPIIAGVAIRKVPGLRWILGGRSARCPWLQWGESHFGAGHQGVNVKYGDAPGKVVG